ncbi:MAG TPA: AraC family transcriptional regulator [Hyphomicrobiaceae bacterium]|nr:AraC family transcriptional regulator [Hyphomicrobiaceae bacterium]
MNRIEDFARLLDRHTVTLGPGMHETVIDHVGVVRAEHPSEQMHTVYNPCLCIVAQGAKRSIAGSSVLSYGPGQYLAVSVDLPVIGEVTAASPSKPYLCLKLDLDCTQLSDLLLEARLLTEAEKQPDLALSVSQLTPEMLDAATRLVGLLDKPWAIGTLGALYERELLYFLLAGPQGGRLRQIARAEGRTAQIVKAVRWIRTRFREAITVEDAAAEAGMSASSFHEHFKAVTAHSPLQYQKLLRLQEARRLMVSAGSDAANAAFAVGYSSPQQFSREYARLFGAPPQRDAARLRAQPAASAEINAA